MRAALALVAMLACTTGATAQQGRPASELAGRVPGQAATCIELDRVTGPLIIDPVTVLYRQSGARIWRMTPQDACPALRQGAHLIMFNTGRRLCAGDRFDVLPPGSAIASGHCRIGGFTPYDKAPR